MAAIKPEISRALAALTSAALGLPGLDVQAATPGAQAQGNVQYGYYQESDNRMKVEVYHGDFSLPVTDRLELTFSVDRDTYSGATPAFSLPETMTNELRYGGGAEPETVDVVSAASGGVNAQGLTVLGGVNTFKTVTDEMTVASQQSQAFAQQASANLDAQKQQSIDSYVAANPNPGSPPTIPGAVTLNFQSIASAVPGKADSNIGSFCPGASPCYQESGMVIGTISDPLNIGGHIHRAGPAGDREAQYHPDSSGFYIRALNGEAFSALRLAFTSLPPSAIGPNDYFEILGFNNAVNPNLSTGDGENYATRIAYQTVSNTHAGVLTLDNAFNNINALWIHYRGNIQDVLNTATTDWDLRIDDFQLDSAQFSSASPAQIAWLAAYNTYLTSLNLVYAPQSQAAQLQAAEQYKQATINIYRNFLNKAIPSNTRVKQTFQTQPVETRTQPVFGAKYYFNDATLAFSGGQSNEPDFNSNFGSINFSQELNNKLTTVSAGYNYTSNDITRNGSDHTDHHASNPDHNPANYPDLHKNSDFHAFNLGLSQVLNKNSLLQLSASYTRQNGYLSNPYKYVYVRGEVTAEEYYALSQATAAGDINWNDITGLEMVGLELFREVRPDLRNQFSLSTRLNQYLPALDAALHMDYRYYRDDWGINSHTLELKWLQKLPFGLSLTPGLRYYSQSQADFFAPYFLAPRADGHYSSDFRLSGYGALSGGLTVAKQFSRGIRLELGMEYYTHQGNLKLGGGGENDYADFNYWMTHANLSIDLSAPGQMFGGGAGDPHHHHHQHGAPLPAGIMFGHMLNEADGLMVGYRYMYANQSGDMRNGASAISDATLLNAHCGPSTCTERPTQMSMHMHMLDLMYAPSDWLNLMIMPQLVDMDMELTPLAGSTGTGEHGGGHETHGLGDTQAAALVKVFDQPGQHMHVSLGISAPTGSVEQTLDGRDEADSNLQDYGMQLGSGTWDFKPSLTYTGQMGDWSWGAQLGGTKRLNDRNQSGYALGDQFQATSWGGYSISQWLSATLRGVYTEQGKIRGEFNRGHAQSAPVDVTANYGGKFWDVGLGFNLRVPNGAMAGHHFSLEWLQPVADRFNGYQLQREGGLSATWSYAF